MSEYLSHDEAMSSLESAFDHNPSALTSFEHVRELVRFAVTDDWGRYDGEELAVVARLDDGRFAALEGGCDYTGWGCQSDLNVSLHDTADEAWLNITREGRAHIERAEASPAPSPSAGAGQGADEEGK